MATGDKKRAVMTDDINNSGSPYPVMPLKTIDQTPTAGNTDHLISSAGVKSALDYKQDAVLKEYGIPSGNYMEFSVPGSGRWMIVDLPINDILLMRTAGSGVASGSWMLNGETINDGHPNRYSYNSSTKKLTITNSGNTYEFVYVFSLNRQPFTAGSPQPIPSTP